MKKVLEVKNLKTSFFTHIGQVQAIRGISFDVEEGEAIGIVGESGSGKSVTMMSVMHILASSGKVIDGQVLFNGEDITKYSEKQMSNFRGNKMGMIFQDPMTSLNPVLSIGDQMVEHYIKHRKSGFTPPDKNKNASTAEIKKDATEAAIKMLESVGIPDPAKRLKQYPHEFSGGMRQRAMIAMTLMCHPELIIADEPTTALDVTIQAQILDLMKKLKNEMNSAIILITHDLGVVADLCSRINVMYGGLIIEQGSDEDIFYNSRHPYTWGLLQSVPNPKLDKKEKLVPIDGQPPDLFKPPVGCPFAARCKYAMAICIEKQPPFYEIGEGHRSACFLNDPNIPNKVESPIKREVM